MGGEAWAENGPATGSVFCFWAPFRLPEQSEASRDIRASEVALEPTRADIRVCRRVLLIEDSEFNVAVARALLKGRDCGIDVAPNGQIGLDMFMADDYDIVLLDMQMPVMDGYETARRIRAFEKETGRAHEPLVALTACALSGDAEKCLEAGCDAYLAKPLTQKQFLGTVSRFVMLRGAGGHVPEDDGADPWDEPQATDAIRVKAPPGLHEIAHVFLQRMRDRLPVIRHDCDAGDFEAVKGVAHQMKGEGASFGFGPVSEMGARLQRAAMDGDASVVRAVAMELQHYLERVIIENGQE